MQFLLKLTDTVSRIILWGFALSVIFLAIMTSLLRYYLPQANHYREPLLELISKQSSYRIQAEEISAQWQFFKPDIRLQGVAIEQAISGQKISLDYLRVQVNIAKTLLPSVWNLTLWPRSAMTPMEPTPKDTHTGSMELHSRLCWWQPCSRRSTPMPA